MRNLFLTGLICAVAAPSLAMASTPKLLSTSGDWQTYARTDSGTKVCYVLAKPSTKSPSNVRHGDIYFMVASWKAGQASEQPSFFAGYSLKPSSPPTAKVGSARFPMYVSQNEGFIEDNGSEKKLVKAMRAGSTMRVEAVSQRGTAVTYNFSLKGVTAALKKAKSACQ